MEQTFTITTGASQYLQAALERAREAQAIIATADGAFTGLIRQLGIEGAAKLVALKPTEIVLEVPDEPV